MAPGESEDLGEKLVQRDWLPEVDSGQEGVLEAAGVPCEGQAEPTAPITEDQAYGGRRADEATVCAHTGEIADRAGQRHRV